MADEFFQRFNAKVVGPVVPVAAATAGAAAAKPRAGGPWLAGAYAFMASFVVTFGLIFLLA
jgi:hypothetical protein